MASREDYKDILPDIYYPQPGDIVGPRPAPRDTGGGGYEEPYQYPPKGYDPGRKESISPPTADAVTAIGEVEIPKQAVVVEKTANGKPAVYEYEGVRYYSPESTMYKMGWRTSEEYMKAQRYGVGLGPHSGELTAGTLIVVDSEGNPYRVTESQLAGKTGLAEHLLNRAQRGEYLVPVDVIADEGKREVLLTAATYERLRSMEPEQQFEKLQRLGIISSGARYVEEGQGGWSYIPEEAVKEYEGRLEEYQGERERFITSIEDFKTPDGTYNITEALKYYAPSTLIGYGFAARDVHAAERQLEAYNDAIEILRPYEYRGQNPDKFGTYRLRMALNSGRPEVIEAAQLVMPQAVELMGKGYATMRPPEPTKIEETVEKAGLTPVVTGAAVYALPYGSQIMRYAPGVSQSLGSSPGGRSAYVLGAAAILTAAGIAWYLGKSRGEAEKIKRDFETEAGREMTTDDLIVVSPQTGYAASLTEILPTAGLSDEERRRFQLPPLTPPAITKPQEQGIIPPRVEAKQPGLIPPDLTPPREGVIPADIGMPYGKGSILPNIPEPVVIIRGVGAVPRELVGAERKFYGKPSMEDLLITSQELVRAEQAVRLVVPKLGELPYTRKQYDAVNKALKEAQTAKAFRMLNTWIQNGEAKGKISPALAQAYYKAYDNYLVQQRAYEAARAQIRQDLTPNVLRGSLTGAALDAYIAREMAGRMGGKGTVSAKDLARFQALTQGKTAIQGQTMAENAAMQSTETATATAAATGIRAATAADTAITDVTATLLSEDLIRPGAPPPIIPRPTASTPDREKREFLAGVEGLIARRRGELHGKSVWHVNFYPYGKEDRLVLMGQPPNGAKEVKGKGSVQKSAVLLRGIPPQNPIYSDTGAVDDVISSQGRGIIVESVQDKGILSPKYRSPNIKEKDLGGGIVVSSIGGRKRRHLKLL